MSDDKIFYRAPKGTTWELHTMSSYILYQTNLLLMYYFGLQNYGYRIINYGEIRTQSWRDMTDEVNVNFPSWHANLEKVIWHPENAPVIY